MGDLIDACERLIPTMFAHVLTGLEKGTIQPKPQPNRPRLTLRGFPREAVDGLIRWEQSAEQIARVVHASGEPYAGAYTFFEGDKLRIWDAQPHNIEYSPMGVPGQLIQRDRDTGAVWILTGDGSIKIKQVSYRSQVKQEPAGLLKSLRIRLGMTIEDEILALNRKVHDLTERVTQIESKRGE